MPQHCPECGIEVERESGFFLGSIYFNCGIATVVTAIAMPLLYFTQVISHQWTLASGAIFAIGFPVLFFPWARSFWLGLDEFLDPRVRNESRKPSS